MKIEFTVKNEYGVGVVTHVESTRYTSEPEKFFNTALTFLKRERDFYDNYALRFTIVKSESRDRELRNKVLQFMRSIQDKFWTIDRKITGIEFLIESSYD